MSDRDEQIIEAFDSNLNITIAELARQFGVSTAHVKKVLMS